MLLAERGLSTDEVAFVGNDINDLPALDYVGLPIVVQDDHHDVVGCASYQTRLPGGHGAVRELCDLFEKVYIIFRLRAFSRNLRNELKKSRKIYFYDNGVRNVLIRNFNPLNIRSDAGALWENYLVSERQKRNSYEDHFCNTYFWRTKQQQEIDYIEEYDGNLHAYEFKWNPKAKYRFSKTFLRTYPNNKTNIIHRDNFDHFL